MSVLHQRISGFKAMHPSFFVQATDPATDPANDVQAYANWINTTTGTSLANGWLWKQRNTGNTAWVTVVDLATALSGVTGSVSSVFGRTGAVVKAGGDYAVADVTGAAPLASPTFTGTVTVPDQSAGDNSGKAANTKYVETAVANGLAGLAWKQPVRVATTSAKTLATDFENGDTIDGVVLATGNAVLIKDQASPSENGIYFVNASGAPTRRTDADAGAELVNATVTVMEGTVNADTVWTCTTNSPITLGSTSIAFGPVGTSGTVAALDDIGDVDATTPANGDLLSYNTSSGKWGNLAPALVSTGGGRWDPMALRAGQTASALDDDWIGMGTTMNVKWTLNANWVTGLYDGDTTHPKHLHIIAPGNSAAQRCAVQAIPAGDFVIQTAITVNPNRQNLSYGHLVLVDGTGGSANIHIVSNYQAGVSNVAVQSGTVASISANNFQWSASLNPAVIRIERTSGTYKFEFSPNGLNGHRITFSPGFTPTHFGIGYAPFADEARVSFAPFRYNATSSTRWGAFL